MNKLVFEQTFEGLYVRGLKERVTPRLERRLADAGLNLKKLQPSYPFELWCRSVQMAAEEVHPGVEPTVAYRMLGERVVDGFAETFLGKALFAVVKALGPKRALYRAQQNFRSGNNYSDARITELGPGRYELWMNEVGDIRNLTGGIVLAALRRFGAQDLKVDVARFDGEGVTYAVQWKE